MQGPWERISGCNAKEMRLWSSEDAQALKRVEVVKSTEAKLPTLPWPKSAEWARLGTSGPSRVMLLTAFASECCTNHALENCFAVSSSLSDVHRTKKITVSLRHMKNRDRTLRNCRALDSQFTWKLCNCWSVQGSRMIKSDRFVMILNSRPPVERRENIKLF